MTTWGGVLICTGTFEDYFVDPILQSSRTAGSLTPSFCAATQPPDGNRIPEESENDAPAARKLLLVARSLSQKRHHRLATTWPEKKLSHAK